MLCPQWMNPHPTLSLVKGEARAHCAPWKTIEHCSLFRESESPMSLMTQFIAKVLRIWPWLAAICSGLLYTGCFAPFNFTWLCWIALTPLIAAILFSGKSRGIAGFAILRSATLRA